MSKRILIISNNFTRGDSITICNFFSSFGNENIYCASKFFDQTSRFKQYYRIGDKEITYSFPFNFLSSVSPSTIINKIEDNSNDAEMRTGLSWLIYKNIILKILQFLGMYENRMTIHLSESFRKWLDYVSPDIVYTSVGSKEMAAFILEVMKEYPRLKYVIQGFDDWMEPSYYTIRRKSFHTECDLLYNKILEKAYLCLASSEYMVEEYKIRYNKEFIYYPNPVNVPAFERVKSAEIRNNVLYIGNIARHNLNAILDMAKAIELFNEDNGDSLVFELYGNYGAAVKKKLLKYKCCNVNSWIDHDSIPRIIKSSGILFLPISVTPSVAKFTRYSMSTKIFEYLLSQRPLIYIGPDSIAMTKFLIKNNCAYVLNSSSPKQLCQGIKIIKSNKDKICEQTINGYRLAKEYDISISSLKLKKYLNDA